MVGAVTLVRLVTRYVCGLFLSRTRRLGESAEDSAESDSDSESPSRLADR